MINKSQLIFSYSVMLVFLVSIGLTYLNPLFCVLTLISAGFLSGFLANKTFFNTDNNDLYPIKYPITEGNTLSNIRTNCDRQMPSGPAPSLSKKEEQMNEKNKTSVDEMTISSEAMSKADKIVECFQEHIYDEAFLYANRQGKTQVEVSDVEAVAKKWSATKKEEQMSEKETIRVSLTFDIDVGSDLDQELEFLHSTGKYSRIKRLVEDYIREKIKDPVSNPDFLKDMKVDFSIHSRTREQIITSMCLTYRHDYWLIKESKNFLSGMTEEERKSLYNQMAKIFDNDIAPYVDLKCFSKKNESSLSVDQLQHLAKTSQPPEGFSADTEW